MGANPSLLFLFVWGGSLFPSCRLGLEFREILLHFFKAGVDLCPTGLDGLPGGITAFFRSELFSTGLPAFSSERDCRRVLG